MMPMLILQPKHYLLQTCVELTVMVWQGLSGYVRLWEAERVNANPDIKDNS